MKIVISLVVFLIAFQLKAQDSLRNFSPNRAYVLCDNPNKLMFGSSTGFVCQGGSSKLYYIIKPSSDVTFTGTTYLKVAAFDATTTPLNSSYKLYGGFNPTDDYATWVENGIVSPVTVSSVGLTNDVTGTLYAGKDYLLEVTVQACTGRIDFQTNNFTLACRQQIACENCIPKFQPVTGTYLVTAWVKEEYTNGNPNNNITYSNCRLSVTANSATTNILGEGQIVDGWQRMEKTVVTGPTGDFKIDLVALSSTVNCYFDDIRVIPNDGSMVSYVYDPITLRLVAELDERNYAKIYEYDEEGNLIRVKKETEKGVFTIQEINQNTSVKGAY